MAFDFALPDIGEGVSEGEVVKWLVKVGDVVREDQPVLEVMTDKATVEISAPRSGKVAKLHGKEGEMVSVGSVLITFDETAGSESPNAPKLDSNANTGQTAPKTSSSESFVPTPTPTPPQPMPESKLTSAKAMEAGFSQATPLQTQKPTQMQKFEVLASPSTRKMARELGIDLSTFAGTGPGGRITQSDLLRATQSATSAGEPMAGIGFSRKESNSEKAKVEYGRRTSKEKKTGEERIPLRGIRKKIAEHMILSKHSAAHFTHIEEVDMSGLVELRKNGKAMAKEKGANLSYLPFIIKALCYGLREFPRLNAIIDDEKSEIVLKYSYNIGIAVATGDGDLVVPVIKDADQKSILEIAREIQSLADKARSNKLSLDDLKDGTFTLTSMGNLGGVFATPILNYPQVGIMGFHQMKDRAVVRDGQIVIRPIAHVSLSLDHRLVDGAVGASFLNEVIRYMETPALLMLADEMSGS